MSFINKTYTHEKDENYKEFLESFGKLTEEQKKMVLQFKPENTVKKEDDQYVLNMTAPGGHKDLKFTDGVEFDQEIFPGKFAKAKFNLDGNVLTQTLNYDDGLSVTYKREFSDDKLVLVITSNKWNGTARRHFTLA